MPVPMQCPKGHKFTVQSPLEGSRNSMWSQNLYLVRCPECGAQVNMPDHGTDGNGEVQML